MISSKKSLARCAALILTLCVATTGVANAAPRMSPLSGPTILAPNRSNKINTGKVTRKMKVLFITFKYTKVEAVYPRLDTPHTLIATRP